MKKSCFVIALTLLPLLLLPSSKWPPAFDRYHTPEEMNQALQAATAAHPKVTQLLTVAKGFGGKSLMLLEIGPETGKKEKKLPAIMVVANLEGIFPISSEAALHLVRGLLEKPDLFKDMTWYILPVGNPDAAEHFFRKPLAEDPRNGRAVNDDMDDESGEDGNEDLNGDGLITQMRKKDPEGEWLPVASDPRLMRRADVSKGEKGIYKLYSEGIDNDADGQYNEDGPGGVNIGITFPHLFQFFSKTSGAWPGSESETFGIIKFVFAHPEIAMTIAFGESNFCMIPPRSGRRGDVDLSKIKIPKQMGSFFGADPDKTYTIDEIKELAQPFVPQGMELTESMIASFLGLGAVVNPLPADLGFYNFLSEKYKEYLKAQKSDAKRLESPDAKDGSFELWSYYHLGLPSFSLDFWTLPEPPKEQPKENEVTPEKLEKMSNEEFIALGPEKIGEFLKSSGAPANFKAEMVIGMVKSGQINTKRMAEMLKQMPKPKAGSEEVDSKEQALLAFSDKELGGAGFVPWKSFSHPKLGEVEIGGIAPFARTTPPEKKIDELLKGQVPWVFDLAGKIPRISILKTDVTPLGGGLFRIKVWVQNKGYLPYPTAMGSRNNRIPPVVVSLEGDGFKIVDGHRRGLIKAIPGGDNRMVSWILQAEQRVLIKIHATSPMAGQDARPVELGGKQ